MNPPRLPCRKRSFCDTRWIGYVRVSKTDGSQSLDLQRDALRAGIDDAANLYHDLASGVRDDQPARPASRLLVRLPAADGD